LTHWRIAALHRKLDAPADALAHYRTAEAILADLVALAPDHATWRKHHEQVRAEIASLPQP
jgi:hypothetical protein